MNDTNWYSLVTTIQKSIEILTVNNKQNTMKKYKLLKDIFSYKEKGTVLTRQEWLDWLKGHNFSQSLLEDITCFVLIRPMIVTRDKIELYLNDDVWIHNPNDKYNPINRIKILDRFRIIANNEYFSSKQAAQDYLDSLKPKLPKSWKEYKDNTTKISYDYEYPLDILQRLLILRSVYRNGWKPDWNKHNIKYCISFYTNNVDISTRVETQELFSFQSKEIRDKFYENFKNELEQLKELY